MANARDSTLIKNRITSWLGEELGLAYTPQMVPVDVVYAGNALRGLHKREVSRQLLSE